MPDIQYPILLVEVRDPMDPELCEDEQTALCFIEEFADLMEGFIAWDGSGYPLDLKNGVERKWWGYRVTLVLQADANALSVEEISNVLVKLPEVDQTAREKLASRPSESHADYYDRITG